MRENMKHRKDKKKEISSERITIIIRRTDAESCKATKLGY